MAVFGGLLLILLAGGFLLVGGVVVVAGVVILTRESRMKRKQAEADKAGGHEAASLDSTVEQR